MQGSDGSTGGPASGSPPPPGEPSGAPPPPGSPGGTSPPPPGPESTSRGGGVLPPPPAGSPPLIHPESWPASHPAIAPRASRRELIEIPRIDGPFEQPSCHAQLR